MVRSKFYAVCITLLTVFILCGSALGADAESLSLADTVYQKPKIIQFFNADDIDNISAEAYLNDEKLTVESIKKAPDLNLKTNYIFLTDESTSITDMQNLKIRESLNSVINDLRDGETMTIVTFGETVAVPVMRSSDKAALKAAADAVSNKQGGTLFFDAVKKAADICNAAPGERNIVFVISDGIDFTDGGHNNYSEVEKYTNDYGITMYGIALGSGISGSETNVFTERFGQLMRSSGGSLSVCTADGIENSIFGFLNTVRNNYAVEMTSRNNVITSSGEKLILKLSDGAKTASLEKNIIPHHWTKDTEAPAITGAEQSGDNSITIYFSEDVLNADAAANFVAVLNDKYYPAVSTASYDSSSCSTVLTFDEGVYLGEYKLSCQNITDNSMEKNALGGEFTLECDGPVYGAGNYGYLYVILALLIIILGTAAIAYAVINKRKGLIVHEKKLMFRDNMVDKEKITAPQISNIHMIVTTPDGQAKRLDMRMYKSIIVGRDSTCDITFSDPAMSRQQFAIEEDNGIYTIMNLSGTNATVVNGVPLTAKIKLSDNDVITAGNEKFVFKAR